MAREHAGVSEDERGVALEAVSLELAGADDAVAHGGGGLAGLMLAELVDAERGGVDVDINPIKERTTDAGTVVLDLSRVAFAAVAAVAEVTAGAGIHSGNN